MDEIGWTSAINYFTDYVFIYNNCMFQYAFAVSTGKKTWIVVYNFEPDCLLACVNGTVRTWSESKRLDLKKKRSISTILKF